MEQPVPDVNEVDVDRILARDFDLPAQDRIRVLLEDPSLTLSPRVVLAVLKLSNGEVGLVAANLESARTDWRDVVAYAEYPAYTKATSGSAPVPDDRRDELVQADSEQYQSWLGGT